MTVLLDNFGGSSPNNGGVGGWGGGGQGGPAQGLLSNHDGGSGGAGARKVLCNRAPEPLSIERQAIVSQAAALFYWRSENLLRCERRDRRSAIGRCASAGVQQEHGIAHLSAQGQRGPGRQSDLSHSIVPANCRTISENSGEPS
jgi:hypothetical protein